MINSIPNSGAAAPATCHGTGVNERTQCAHYHSERDIIAIKFKCCDTFYACIHCHAETASHAPLLWSKAEFDTQAILCGNCQTTLTVAEYLACENACPYCRAAFNPGCVNHYHLYFETA